MHAAQSIRLRPKTAAAAFGGVVSLAVGGAYLGGVAAQASTVRVQAERLQGAGSEGYTQEAMAAAAGGLDASALAIADRHDPYSVAGAAQRDRQAELLTARLEESQNGLRRASLTNPAARPFRLGSALDQSRDLDCLTKAAYYEARGEGVDGMRAVAQVVLNRARHPAFPKTVCGVVFQGAARSTGCQFSFTCNGAMRGRVNSVAWSRARDVASKALSGSVDAAVGNATHFHTTAVSPGWRNSMIRVNQVGSHLFYRFGGRAGSRGAFSYQPQPSRDADQPRLIQAGLNPVETARQAGQAVAYTMLLAQEGLGQDARPQERAQEARNEAVVVEARPQSQPQTARVQGARPAQTPATSVQAPASARPQSAATAPAQAASSRPTPSAPTVAKAPAATPVSNPA